MSSRKNQARFQAMKRLDPDYKGFRGHQQEPARRAPMESVACSRCGRKRNIPLGIALEQEAHYVCIRCREQEEE